MAVYAYADETIFSLEEDSDKRALGCGILICKTEITKEVIEEAICNLSNDPELDKKKDIRTLGRHYFHASDDSKNAHSHFCNSINKHIKGIFDFTYFDNSTEKQLSNLIHTEETFKRCLTNSTMELFNDSEEVFLVIEQRQQLNTDKVEKWKQLVYKLFEGATYDIPSFKTYFPKINILLAGKTNPGLQVVDFMLWAVNRSKKMPPSKIWMERLSFKTWHYYKDEKGNNRGQYYFNRQPDLHFKENYELPFQKAETWEEVINAFILIERILRNLNKSDFSDKSNHLWQELCEVSKMLNDNSIYLKSQEIEHVGRLFIRLFDTLPLYKNIHIKEEWKLMFHAKYLASMLIRHGQIHLERTRSGLQRWRYKMQTEFSDEFFNLMK